MPDYIPVSPKWYIKVKAPVPYSFQQISLCSVFKV